MPSVARAAVVEHSGLLREYSLPSHVLGFDSPRTHENSGHDHTKKESTDMGEEGYTTATAVRQRSSTARRVARRRWLPCAPECAHDPCDSDDDDRNDDE